MSRKVTPTDEWYAEKNPARREGPHDSDRGTRRGLSDRFPWPPNANRRLLGNGHRHFGTSEPRGRTGKKAIAGFPPTEEDKRFLRNLYSCFGKGGQLTIVLRQSGQLMQHYLSGSGDGLRTSPRIFLNSRPVQEALQSLKKQIMADFEERGNADETYSSQTFYMGDPEFPDSHVGLYFGHVAACPHVTKKGTVALQWRAEVPWRWPSYASLHDKYGNYHAQCFPIPNARSWLQGSEYCLRMDDGLGGYLAEIGLAKPFLAYAEWEEEIKLPARSARRDKPRDQRSRQKLLSRQ
jgi:hypothetical protein